jgi:phosphate transport system ATP-binding protein
MMPSSKIPKHLKIRAPVPMARDPPESGIGPAKIEIRSLNFYYGNVRALANISMTVADRAITAFIGPSGCGKSTLLRVLNRMYALYPQQRAEGEVRIGGEDILSAAVDVPDLRYRIGMVFQRPTPFPMTVFENVAFGLRLHGAARGAELHRRVEVALRDAALWDEVKDMLHKDGRGLSGGQQQRLCIARTIAVNPEVLLLDEPTAALDPISTLRIEETLQVLREKFCIVIVTHNLQQAARVSNVTGFMYMGELVEMGLSSEIFTTPKNRKTDDYITGRFG